MFDQAKKYFFQPLPENFESFPCLSWQEEKSSPDLRYPIALCTAGREKVDEQSQQIVVLKISGSATKISPPDNRYSEIQPGYGNQHRPPELFYSLELMKHQGLDGGQHCHCHFPKNNSVLPKLSGLREIPPFCRSRLL